MGFFELIFWFYIIPAIILYIGTIIFVIMDTWEELFTIGDIIDSYKSWIKSFEDAYYWIFFPGANLIIILIFIIVCISFCLRYLFSLKISKCIYIFFKLCFKQFTKSIKWCFNIITLPFRLLWYKFRSIRIK